MDVTSGWSRQPAPPAARVERAGEVLALIREGRAKTWIAKGRRRCCTEGWPATGGSAWKTPRCDMAASPAWCYSSATSDTCCGTHKNLFDLRRVVVVRNLHGIGRQATIGSYQLAA
jgi:hypothetical protein